MGSACQQLDPLVPLVRPRAKGVSVFEGSYARVFILGSSADVRYYICYAEFKRVIFMGQWKYRSHRMP